MHTHKFIFTYEGHAICEEPSCNYRFTLSEIKGILASIANKPAAEQPLALDLALPPAKDDTYKIEWLDGDTVRLTPSQ